MPESIPWLPPIKDAFLREELPAKSLMVKEGTVEALSHKWQSSKFAIYEVTSNRA